VTRNDFDGAIRPEEFPDKNTSQADAAQFYGERMKWRFFLQMAKASFR
jgi:hypothetical protein